MYGKSWDYTQCRTKLRSVEAESDEVKVKMLNEILQHNRPVLRLQFYDSHKQASKWFEMRLNYTRSVAVTSIVGHVLGIGDRHLSNTLLDKVKGEMVPIDFGVAFDAVYYSLRFAVTFSRVLLTGYSFEDPRDGAVQADPERCRWLWHDWR